MLKEILEILGSLLAGKKIRQLEVQLAEAKADIDELLEQLALGTDKPSPADIVKESAFSVVDSKIIIDLTQINIPFTQPPRVIPIFSIPDTGSMDGIFDYGNSQLYIEPVDEENHQIMVDWIANQWQYSAGLQTVDCVYRIMQDEVDDPRDFTKPPKWYSIHRLSKVSFDNEGRYFWFAGVNNPYRDPFICRDKNILWLSMGTIY